MKPILIVVAPYYTEISKMLVLGADAAIKAAGYTSEIVEVAGALEIPTAISMAHESGEYAGFVALGCVLRGETTHYDTVANESARGLMDISLREHAAIGNGILTCETEEQAIVRADMNQGNKGGEAVRAVLSLIALQQKFGLES